MTGLLNWQQDPELHSTPQPRSILPLMRSLMLGLANSQVLLHVCAYPHAKPVAAMNRIHAVSTATWWVLWDMCATVEVQLHESCKHWHTLGCHAR